MSFPPSPSDGQIYVSASGSVWQYSASDDAWKRLFTPIYASIGLFANRPTAGTSGKLYYATDASVLYIDDGSSWHVVTGTWNWSVKTEAYNANASDAILCDTASVGAFSVTLPSSPAQFDRVKIIDAVGNFGTANLTLDRNGNNIMGLAEDFIFDENYLGLTFVYHDTTNGWRFE